MSTSRKKGEQADKLIHKNEALDVEDQDLSKSPSLNESADETDWKSIYCTSLLAFFTAIQFSLYYSSLWPYLQIIDKETTESFFGYIVAIYSFAQILGSICVGYWSNRIKQMTLPIYITIIIMFIGNVLFIFIELLPNNQRYWLLLSRFITGFGSSNISLLKSYVAIASGSFDRSKSIAFVTGGIAVGMFLGPGFQLLFLPLNYPGIQLPFGKLHLYNAPAYFAILLNIICITCVKLFFREHYAGLVNKNSDAEVKIKIPPYDKLAVLICYFTRFTQILANSTLETLSPSLSMALFAWSRHDVVEYIAAAQLMTSFLAFLTYLLFIVLNADRFINFRLCCIVSLFGLAAFYLITLSWPFIPGNVVVYHHNQSATDEQLGCDDKFTWCYSLRPVNVFVYYISYVLIIGLSFANINVSLNTIFSKIIGPRRQGTQQGLLQVSGGIGRMLGPITASILYSLYGPVVVWTFVIFVIALNILLWVVYYEKMVPLEMPPNLSSVD